MVKAEGWLRGGAEVRVTGAEPQKFLNRCVGEGIGLEDVTAEGPFTLRLRLPARRVEEAERLAERCGCLLERISDYGLPRARRTVRRRWLLFAGMALFFLALYVSSLFVWEITVTENDSTVSDAEILRVLAAQGVGTGSFWPGFRGERIRTEALRELPGLSFLAVNVRGGRAEVEVRAVVPQPEIWDPGIATDIVAARSGVIDSMFPLSGTPLVSRGDAVTEGQVLIQGTEIAPHALGEINAYTYYELTAVTPLTVSEKTYSGRERHRFALILGSRRINFYADSGILPASCDKITKTAEMAVENAFTFPVKWVTETWRPYTTQERAVDPEEAQVRLEGLLLERLGDAITESGEVRQTHFSVANDGVTLTVTLRAECLERIDVDTPRTNE